MDELTRLLNSTKEIEKAIVASPPGISLVWFAVLPDRAAP